MYTLVLPNAARLSEFVVRNINGDCVETAMAVAVGIADGEAASPQGIIDIVHSMQAAGVASANGATTINAAHDWLQQNGHEILEYVPYGEPFQGDWLALLREHAGIHPIVLNVARGGALEDTETGAHDEPNVKYHALACVGRQSDGYMFCDGDNPQASERFQMYTRQTIEAAQPCGMVVIGLRTPTPTPAPAAPPQGGTTMSTVQDLVAAGWHDDGTTLTAPNGHVVVRGFRAHVLDDAQRWQGDEQPLESETQFTTANDTISRQRFNHRVLYYSQSDDKAGKASIWEGDASNEWIRTDQMLADVDTQLATANALVIALQTQANQLQAQVTQLQSVPVVTVDPDLVALAQALTTVVLKTEKAMVVQK